MSNDIFAISDDGMVKVEWTDLSEGRCGDFNPDDPDDVALLRYDAVVRRTNDSADEQRDLEPGSDPDWGIKDNGSYCTQVEVDTDDATLEVLARMIANALADNLDNGGWKSTAERMSWVDVTWAETATRA